MKLHASCAGPSEADIKTLRVLLEQQSVRTGELEKKIQQQNFIIKELDAKNDRLEKKVQGLSSNLGK